MLKHISKSANNILRYAVAAMILAVPLYPKFPLLRVPGTYVSIRLEDFIISIVVLIWGLSILPSLRKFLQSKINRSILLFLAIGLLSVISGMLLTQTVIPHIGILHWARRVEYLLCFFIGVSSVKDSRDLAFYVKCLLIVLFLAFVYGFGQKYFAWPVITTQNYEYAKGVALRFMPGGHLVSTFAGHYDLASFLVLVLPLFVVLAVSKNSLLKIFGVKKTVLLRIAFILAITAGVWLIVQSASRIAVASYFLSVILALVLVRKYIFIPIVILVSILFIATSSNLLNRYMQIFNVYVKKLISVEQQMIPSVYAQSPIATQEAVVNTPEPEPVVEDRSTSIRLNVEWPRAIRAFQKNPLLGSGFSSITLATDNDYLRLLGEAGMLGFISFGLIFVRFGELIITNLKNVLKKNFRSRFVLAIAASLPGIFVNALFIDIFEASKFAIMFWLLLGMAVSVINMKSYDK